MKTKGTSDQAVSDYLDNLFFDDCLPPIAQVAKYIPSDTVDKSCRLQTCDDAFALMSMNNTSPLILWHAFLQMLLLAGSLPPSQLKSYVFKQSQVLYSKINSQAHVGSG